MGRELVNVDWIRLDWIHLLRVFRVVFCRGGVFFVPREDYFWLLLFFGREGFLDVFQRIELKKGEKRELSNKNKKPSK